MTPRTMLRHLPPEKRPEFRLLEIAIMRMRDDLFLGRDDKGKLVKMTIYILTWAVALEYNLKRVFVTYEGKHHHAVLEGFHPGFLIDLNPIATGGGPLLIWLGEGSPWLGKYKPAIPPEASRARMMSRWFYPAVRRTRNALFKAIPEVGSELREAILATA